MNAGSSLLPLEATKVEIHAATGCDTEVVPVVAGDRVWAKALLGVFRAVGGAAGPAT